MNYNNLFVKEIKVKDDIEPQKFDEYPLNINAIRFFVSLKFTTPVTIFSGENGCGKSTLIEAIAANLNIPIIGGNYHLSQIIESYDNGEEKGSELAQYLIVSKGYTRPYNTFFFRAESFYKLADILSHDEYIINRNYGDKDLLEESHGESFIDFMNNQLKDNSLYLFDEPEAALSPQNQLKLLGLIDKYSKRGCQFTIATHSPLILGYKNARLINLDNGMNEIDFKQTNIYKIYKEFLDSPEEYQEYLFEDE